MGEEELRWHGGVVMNYTVGTWSFVYLQYNVTRL